MTSWSSLVRSWRACFFAATLVALPCACEGSSFSNGGHAKKSSAADAGDTSEASGATAGAEDVHADPPPQDVTGSFLTCAKVTPKQASNAPDASSVTFGCDVVDAQGHVVALDGADVTAKIVTAGDSHDVQATRTGESGYELLFVIPTALAASGQVEIHVSWSGHEAKTLTTPLTFLAPAAPAAAATPGQPWTFSGRWSHVDDVCKDPGCDALSSKAYCDHGTVRPSLLTDSPVDAGLLTIETGSFAVDLAKACVREFRRSDTEHDQRCFAVELDIEGVRALYILRDTAAPSTYEAFDALMHGKLCQ